MRLRVAIAAMSLLLLGACSTAAPRPESDVPSIDSPIGAVERAQEVANQVEQRQAELEAQLRDPFAQP